ncbi:sce7726 family protein [Pseudomonas sp. N-137]|uniref:sce7726 family protein n=1 Tax=Pseudomonas sp. N-137 TaxID=3108452 RepID=UPI002ADEA6D1|nr:sce7726 family protein [Pseudomonas sp. N-137]MEA1030712.1 sce7726 family protein [Pseudomonas sp. N-137]
MGEKEVKSLVLNSLLMSGRIAQSTLVFSEMSLAKKVRRVDLGFIQGSEMVAIEVKSEKDSLFRLLGQVDEYRKYFDRVVVAVAPKFTKSVLAVAEDDVAVWEVSSGGVRVVRKGRLIKNISKESYIDLMTKREVSILAKRVGLKPEKLAMYELKVEVLSRLRKASKADIKEILLNGIQKRFGLASNRFLSKVRSSGNVNVADVDLLSPYLTRLESLA